MHGMTDESSTTGGGATSTPSTEAAPGAVRAASSGTAEQAERVHDAVVLGAGMSGLVAASVLLEGGAADVVVLDEYPRVGGNHLDVAVGPYTFDVGSFIFQDDSPLLRHFPQLMDHYLPIRPSWARLNPQGVVTEYPFSLRDDVLAAGPLEVARIVGSAVLARLDPRPLRNARDFARHWIGRRFLHRSGLENYMARFCGCPIELIDLTFARSRMLWISDQTTVRALARRLRGMLRPAPPTPPTNRQLARPRGGFAELYAPVVAHLEGRGTRFELGVQLGSVQRTAVGFVVQTDRGPVHARRLVATIPVARTAALCAVPFTPLPSVRLVSLFYSFEGRRGFDTSILYNFSHDARWKRLTVYSDFYGTVEGRHYFAVEVVAGADTGVDEAAAEFRAHTAANGLLAGDLRLEGSHELTEAYPIYTGGSAERAAETVAALRELGVESFGRQGGFQYQPTARVSTIEAERALAPAPAPAQV